MSLDRRLVDAIKARFAGKSSAQLQEITQARDGDRWSPEAIAAAGEVLEDRRAGRATEPQVAEEDPEPPPLHYEPDELALGVLTGLLTGYLVIPYYRKIEIPDLPQPFGPRVAWLALDTTDTEAVAKSLALQGAREVTWAIGVESAYQSSVFVTPPVGDWTLAVSTSLFPPDDVVGFVKPLLERLSRQFGEAQYFCTQRDIDLHLWARARKGRLLRGYGWLGQKRLTLWNEGTQTKEEQHLGFQLSGDRSTAAKRSDKETPTIPDEGAVMQLASLWSIDPTTLDEQFREPQTGLLGTVGWVEGGARGRD
jgi:hypothetical protein